MNTKANVSVQKSDVYAERFKEFMTMIFTNNDNPLSEQKL